MVTTVRSKTYVEIERTLDVGIRLRRSCTSQVNCILARSYDLINHVLKLSTELTLHKSYAVKIQNHDLNTVYLIGLQIIHQKPSHAQTVACAVRFRHDE